MTHAAPVPPCRLRLVPPIEGLDLDPLPENLRGGGSSRERAIVLRVWRKRAEAFALAEAGHVPVFDVATGAMRALPRGPLYGFVSVLLGWATEAFRGGPLLVLVMDPLDTSDEPMILDLPRDEQHVA